MNKERIRKLSRALKGCNATKFLMGISVAVFIYMPIEAFIKLVHNNVIISGFVEIAQFSGILILPWSWYELRSFPKARRFLGFVLISALLALASFNFGQPFASFAGYVKLFGAVSIGIFFPLALRYWRGPRSSLIVYSVLLALAIIMSSWMILENKLGLKNIFPTSFTERGFERFQRSGTVRSRFSFDAPMAAGQYLWLLASSLVCICAPAIKSRNLRLLGYAAAGVSCIAIFSTYSRGPMILVVGSAIFILLHFLWHQRKRPGIIIAFLCMAGFVVSFLGIAGFPEERYAAQLDLIRNPLDIDAAGNSGRFERIQEGARALRESGLRGAGMNLFTHFNLENTGLAYQASGKVNFENTYLSIIYTIGVGGIVLSLTMIFYLLQGIINTSRHGFQRGFSRSELFTVFGGAIWLLYSNMFPAFPAIVGGFAFSAMLGLVFCNLIFEDIKFISHSRSGMDFSVKK
jgi:hypothetical protein